MRRMITTKLLEWAKKLFENIQTDGTKTEVGGDLEVDGNLVVNGSAGENIVASDFIQTIANVSVNDYSVIKIGNLIMCDFNLVNNTGAQIDTSTQIATIKTGFRPTHNHYAACFIGGSGISYIQVTQSSGTVTLGGNLGDTRACHINMFYKIA